MAARPELIHPMLAVAGALPTRDADWGYEMKWDGVRAVVYLGDGAVRIYSRNDRDVSVRYPELAGLAEAFAGQDLVLDGEIVAFDQHGRPNFGRLQQRMHIADATVAAQLSRTVPAVYLAFDLLRLDGHLLTGQSYAQRRELLERLDVEGPSWHTPPAFHGSAADAFAASKEQGLEGVVAKRLDSVYRPGVRTAEWTKVKNIHTQEVVIGGWRPGQGRRADTIGSLLMGVPGPDGLAYVGHVGTGFTQAFLTDLSARLARLRTDRSPFAQELPRADSRDAQWVRPRIVGEVAFSERTADDRLRHPSWRGLRPDKDPADVVPEA
jgi:bifunctional non-homologous end joining protein LigD